MASEVRSQESRFFHEVASQLKWIEGHSDAPNIPEKIRVLGEQIDHYLAGGVQFRDFRCSFFAFELRDASRQMKSHAKSQEPLLKLIKKVARASDHLEKAIKWERKNFPLRMWRADGGELPAFNAALKENRVDELRRLSENLEELGNRQVLSLIDWAIKNWEAMVLCRLLQWYSFLKDDSDRLVDTALAKKELEEISFPLILYQFDLLSQNAQTKIETWFQDKAFGLMGLALKLDSLKEVLEELILDSPCYEFREIRHLESKEELNPSIEEISKLFSQVPEKKKNQIYNAAHKGWMRASEAWLNGVSPSEIGECVQQITDLFKGDPFVLDKPNTWSSLGQEEEEKHDTRAIYEQLLKAVHGSDSSSVEKTMQNPNLYYLSSDEIRILLKEAASLPSSICLQTLLRHRHFSNLEISLFAPLLIEALQGEKWETAQFLMNTSSFQKLAIEQLFEILDLVPSAQEGIRFLITDRISSLQ